MTKAVNMIKGQPVTNRIMTVAEFADQLAHMVEMGHGELPVFSSDGRARYPFSTVIPYTPSGYADCLLIQPQPHLHAADRQLPSKGASYFEFVNAEADRIRDLCGAFA